MQTRSPQGNCPERHFSAKPPTTLPSGPGRLQLLPPNLIVAEHVEGCILTQSDLHQFADYLAEEFEHDQVRAMWEPAAWYQEQVGPEICSEKEAVLLRQMTIQRCKLGALQELLATDKPVPWWIRHGTMLADLIGFALAMGLMLLIVFFGYTDGPQ